MTNAKIYLLHLYFQLIMTGVENYLNEVICLQLKKPKNWNWQISTSKSSPHIALPTIQLYNSRGKLLGKLPTIVLCGITLPCYLDLLKL